MTTRILIVDDDKLIINVINSTIRRLGHETIATTSGHEALQLLDDQPFGLVICDLNLADICGTDVGRRAQARDVPVLMISGDLRSSSHGADPLPGATLLQKPFGVRTLRSTIADMLQQPPT